MDVNGSFTIVSEESPTGSTRLTKISHASHSSRASVALPAGSGRARDVRIADDGDGASWALAACLGKRLVVVDLARDGIAACVRTPAPAWSCAWGGWSVATGPGASVNVSSSRDASSADPARDPNYFVVGLANGETLMYDLRRASEPVARVPAEEGSHRH